MLASPHWVISLLCNLYDNDQVPWGWLPPHRLPASYATAYIAICITGVKHMFKMMSNMRGKNHNKTTTKNYAGSKVNFVK